MVNKPSGLEQPDEMTFWGHLDVLRMSLYRILGVLLVTMILSFIALPHIFDRFILGPTDGSFFLYRWLSALHGVPFAPDFGDGDFHVDIININVATQFMKHFVLSFWMGLVLGFPFVLYEIWKFIKPALFPNEEKSLSSAFVFGGVMFYLGCALGYCVIFPFAFRFLTQYQLSELIENQISMDSYLNNFLIIIFMMGLLFELPLMAMVLSNMKIIHRGFMRKYRKHASVALLVLAAVITPTGDPFTLAVVFIPLFLLYELSIMLVRPAPKEEDDDDDDDPRNNWESIDDQSEEMKEIIGEPASPSPQETPGQSQG